MVDRVLFLLKALDLLLECPLPLEGVVQGSEHCVRGLVVLEDVDLLIGFPARFEPKSQQVEPVMMTSRDGRHFRRWPEALIPITAVAKDSVGRTLMLGRTSQVLRLPGNRLVVKAATGSDRILGRRGKRIKKQIAAHVGDYFAHSNRLLAEHLGIDLAQWGYPVEAAPQVKTVPQAAKQRRRAPRA